MQRRVQERVQSRSEMLPSMWQNQPLRTDQAGTGKL